MRHKSNDKRLNKPSVLIFVCFFLSLSSVIAVAAFTQIAMYIYLFYFIFLACSFLMINRKCERLNLERRYDSEKSMSNRSVQHQIFS